MDEAIFKAYDIRGLYPQELDRAAAVAIGRAVARFLGGRAQELALAFAIEIDGEVGIAALFAGSDGCDGPTDAAG